MSDLADIGDLEHFPEGWRYRLLGQAWSQTAYKEKTHADYAMTEAWASRNKKAAGIGGLQGIGARARMPGRDVSAGIWRCSGSG